MNRAIALRVAVSVGVVAATLGAAWLTVPGLDAALIASSGMDRTQVSVVSLGIVPWVTASVLVELGALTRRSWRAMRVGGPTARAPLDRAVRSVWLAVCIVQGFALATAFEAMGIGFTPLVVEPGWPFRVVVVLSLTAGSALVRLGIDVIDRWGFGNGFAVLLGWPLLASTVQGVALPVLIRDEHVALLVPTLVAVVGYVGLAVALIRGWLGPRLVAFAPAGVVPATFAAGIATTATVIDPALPWLPVALAAGVALTPLFIVAFDRPEVVALATGRPADEVRALVPTATWIGIAVVAALLLGDPRGPAGALAPAAVGSVAIATVTAIGWDLRQEWLARRSLGAETALATAWSFHRTHGVAPALAALAAAGIPAHVRGLAVRRLHQVFAPYVPIEVLVPSDRVDEARDRIAASPVVG